MLNIALNRISGKWDIGKLEKMVYELSDKDLDLDLDLTGLEDWEMRLYNPAEDIDDEEIAEIAGLLKGKSVKKEFWICTARPVKKMADQAGYTKTIEDAGAKFACDTCLAVAPLKGRFKGAATNSAKGVFYGRGHNGFKTKFKPLEECIRIATGE